MNSSPVFRFARTRPLSVVMLLALLVVLGDAVFSGMGMHANFGTMGNDDIMRLTLVRDWLAGQDWYDMTQYRLLPPEGVSFHWSRFIDVGIAAIILPLSLIFQMDTAEQIAVTIWPTLIMIIHLSVVAFGAKRLFGTTAACFSVICMVIWPVTGDLHSGAGNLDHHNVQMLMMTLMALAAVWPDRPVAAGMVGGLAGAFSLAIGLESLPFVVAVGTVILLRTVIVATSALHRLLVAFCAALGLGSVLFWLGQTPPDIRFDTLCDQLGLPTLSLVGIAAGACIVPLAIGRLRARPMLYLFAVIALTGVGLAEGWPRMSVCLDGPYGNLPPSLQDFIDNRISEAEPGWDYARSRPEAFMIFTLPVFAAMALGAGLWMADRRRADQPAFRTQALAGLLVLCLIGIAMIFVQMRAVIIAGSVVPLIGGYVVAHFFDAYLKNREPVRGLVMIIVGIVIISPATVAQAVQPVLPKSAGSAIAASSQCREYGSLIALNEVPPGKILNYVSFGPSLLWATHHDVLSAGYHRSAETLANSIIPYQLDEPALRDFILASGATHFLLCQGQVYDGAFATSLANGTEVDWLRRVPVSNDEQILLEVLP